MFSSTLLPLFSPSSPYWGPLYKCPRPFSANSAPWNGFFSARPALPLPRTPSPSLGSSRRRSGSWPCPQSRPVAPAPPRRLSRRPRPGPYCSRGASRREGGGRGGREKGGLLKPSPALTVRVRRFATNGPTTPDAKYRDFSLQKLNSKMEVLERPCGVPRGSSEFQRMASRGSAAGRGSVAKVQLDSAEAPSLPCADAVAAAAAAAAATAFAATVSAAAVPALPLGASIVPAVSGPEARPPSGFRNGRRPTELRHQGAGGTGSGRGQRGNPGEPGAERGAAGSRGGEVCGLRSWGFLSPARLSPPASPSGVGAPAGAPGDEPGPEVAGECGPGTRAGVASGEGLGYFRGVCTEQPDPGAPWATPAARTDSALAPSPRPRATEYPPGLPGPMAGGEPCLTCYASTEGKRRRIRERAAGTAWARPDRSGPRPLLPAAP